MTTDTFRDRYPRVSTLATSNVDVRCTKGTPVRQITSSLIRLITGREPLAGPGWWTYFGSFGDDFFGDPDTELA